MEDDLPLSASDLKTSQVNQNSEDLKKELEDAREEISELSLSNKRFEQSKKNSEEQVAQLQAEILALNEALDLANKEKERAQGEFIGRDSRLYELEVSLGNLKNPDLLTNIKKIINPSGLSDKALSGLLVVFLEKILSTEFNQQEVLNSAQIIADQITEIEKKNRVTERQSTFFQGQVSSMEARLGKMEESEQNQLKERIDNIEKNLALMAQLMQMSKDTIETMGIRFDSHHSHNNNIQAQNFQQVISKIEEARRLSQEEIGKIVASLQNDLTLQSGNQLNSDLREALKISLGEEVRNSEIGDEVLLQVFFNKLLNNHQIKEGEEELTLSKRGPSSKVEIAGFRKFTTSKSCCTVS